MMSVDIQNQEISKTNTNTIKKEYRKIMVPANRMKPLKENWTTIVKALVEHMKLQVRMNSKLKCIELRTCDKTDDISSMHKSNEFLKAYLMGFDLQDAIALLRLEDLYLETFEVKDVKNLQGDHLSRCIGRICGEKGKTKYAIENSTRTRIIVQDSKISLLGSSTNIALARNALCSLILGAPPGKVYSQLKIVGKRINEKI
jgi:RNA-binding protein PNO1